MGYPNYQSYEDFKKNLIHTWNRVKDDQELLNFVAKNAKSWFDRNCKINSNLNYLMNKINIKEIM
jgi:hypothetical protein